MLKGHFMIKNHKKLVIERQGREFQNKRIVQNDKILVKSPPFILNENLHQPSKQQGMIGQQKRRKSVFSIQKSNENLKKQMELGEIHEGIFRRTLRMKSCFYFPREPTDHQSPQQKEDELMFYSVEWHNIFTRFINILKLQGWFIESTYSTLEFKMDQFSKLIAMIIHEIPTIHTATIKNQKVTALTQCLWQLKNLINEQLQSANNSRLKLRSNIMCYQYNSDIYRHQQNIVQNRILELVEEEGTLQKRVLDARKNLFNISSECQMKQERHCSVERQLYSFESERNKIEQELKKLTAQLQQTKTAYNQISRKEEEILNYVMRQQNNRIIKLVSEDYKQIESDIYQYAVYLQSNQLASSLDYESHPFQLLENQLIQEMKNVNKFIIQEESLPLPEKSKAMRDFVLKAVDRFKKKDEQSARLCQFKTKCIRQFVDKMKKWLNNWELKQEYLVNLRRQFGADSAALVEKIDQIDDELENFEELQFKLRELKLIFQKIEVNYKLGNSFY